MYDLIYHENVTKKPRKSPCTMYDPIYHENVTNKIRKSPCTMESIHLGVFAMRV